MNIASLLIMEGIIPMNKKPAVFFDRDGVLNHDIGYLYRKEDFQWIDGAIQAIKYFNDHGYWVFVITNQSGVARDFYCETDVRTLHTWMNQELEKHNAHIDDFYYCPHHTEGKIEQYRAECTCRKPKPGMILRAIDEWPIKLDKSFIVGDRKSDLEAAQAAGLSGFLFKGGNLYDFIKERLEHAAI